MSRRLRFGVGLALVLALVLACIRLLDVMVPDLSGWQRAERGPVAVPPLPLTPEDSRTWIYVHPHAGLDPRMAPPVDAVPFARMDWGFAWLNVLEQELGHATCVATTDLAGIDLSRCEIIVVSRKSSAEMDGGLRSRLSTWLNRGGVLILDRPATEAQGLAGVKLAAESVPAQRFTAIAYPRLATARGATPGSDVAGSEWIHDCPAPTVVFPLEGGVDAVETVLEIDGAPAVVERRVGRGMVQTFAFDLPRWLVAIQQGTPATDEYRVEKRFGWYEWLLEPEDIVCDDRLLDNAMPFADLLEDFLADRWTQAVPRARFWRFPADRDGAFLMTHDEDLQGGEATAFLAEHEAAIGATSTFFLIPNRRMWETWKEPRDWFAWYEERGSDLQLHWNVLPMPIGFWKIEPMKLRYRLPQQIEILSREIEPPIANRTHYLIIGDHFTESFRLLTGNDIRWDTTFGPNRGGRGYLFGTGLPYRPLDTNGYPFDLREVPFVTQEDWGGASPEFMDRLLRESQAFTHQVIIPIFHPHLITLEPEGAEFWRGTYEAARRSNHWITNFIEWDAFWQARLDSRCRSTFLASASGTGGKLEVDVDVVGRDLAVQVPASIDGVPLRSVAVDGKTIESRVVATVAGRYHLVPVTRDSRRVSASYAVR